MSEPDEPRRPSEEVGSVGDEAAKLLGALSGWARESAAPDPMSDPVTDSPEGSAPPPGLGAGLGESLSGLADQAAAAFSQLNAHVATGSDDCTYCPICRTVHAVRQTSPEVRAHLAGAASSFLQAVVGLLATVPPRPAAAGGAAVERIDLDDTDDPADDEDDDS